LTKLYRILSTNLGISKAWWVYFIDEWVSFDAEFDWDWDAFDIVFLKSSNICCDGTLNYKLKLQNLYNKCAWLFYIDILQNNQ
jgi:hypothetical protein